MGGQPGLATLVIAVSVGLFIQNWDRGVDILTLALDSVGLSQSEVREVPPSLPSAARGKLPIGYVREISVRVSKPPSFVKRSVFKNLGPPTVPAMREDTKHGWLLSSLAHMRASFCSSEEHKGHGVAWISFTTGLM